MKRIAKFEKVSFDEFVSSLPGNTKIDDAKKEYDLISLPLRATSGSAGYDFFLTRGIALQPKTDIKLPTGIRCRIKEGWFLGMYPKSGLGFKYKVQLYNTVGIIDSDYYYSDNEGHIGLKIFNDGDQPIILDAGKAICQGIFTEYGITDDDNATEIRNGGFGSTGK